MPSSFAALLHGMFTAVGMWPARCACSCGRWAGASSRPRTRPGSGRPPGSCCRSRRRPRRGRRGCSRSASLAVYFVAGRLDASSTSSRASSSHFLRPPSSRRASLVAVQLEVPVRVGREPVVVAPVEDDGVVAADPALGQQRLELLPVDEVASNRVLQVLLPVQLHGTRDVASVVRAWCPRRPRPGRPRHRRDGSRPSRRRPIPRRGSCVLPPVWGGPGHRRCHEVIGWPNGPGRPSGRRPAVLDTRIAGEEPADQLGRHSAAAVRQLSTARRCVEHRRVHGPRVRHGPKRLTARLGGQDGVSTSGTTFLSHRRTAEAPRPPRRPRA